MARRARDHRFEPNVHHAAQTINAPTSPELRMRAKSLPGLRIKRRDAVFVGVQRFGTVRGAGAFQPPRVHSKLAARMESEYCPA